MAEWLRRSPGAYFDLSKDYVKKRGIRPRIVRHNNMYNILTVHVFSSPQQLINATKCDEFTFVLFTPFDSKTLRRMSY